MKHLLLAAVLAVALAAPAHAAYYLKVEGVEGESSATASVSTQVAATSSVSTGSSTSTMHKVDAIKIEARVSPSGTTVEVPVRAVEASPAIVQYNETDLDFLTGVSVKRGDTTADVEITVDGATVRGWDPKVKQEITAAAKASVRTDAELAVLAAATAASDTAVESISLNFSKIEWNYRTQGRLFGFLSVPLRKTITVELNPVASERVKIKYPWYAFLTSVDVPQEDLTTDVDAEVRGEADLASFEAQARVFTAVSNVLKTKHDTAKNSINNVR